MSNKRSRRGKRWFYACGQQDKAYGFRKPPRYTNLEGWPLCAYLAGFHGWSL